MLNESFNVLAFVYSFVTVFAVAFAGWACGKIYKKLSSKPEEVYHEEAVTDCLSKDEIDRLPDLMEERRSINDLLEVVGAETSLDIKNIKLKDSYCLCNLKSPYYTKQYLPISEDIMQVFILSVYKVKQEKEDEINQIIGKGIEHGKASC